MKGITEILNSILLLRQEVLTSAQVTMKAGVLDSPWTYGTLLIICSMSLGFFLHPSIKTLYSKQASVNTEEDCEEFQGQLSAALASERTLIADRLHDETLGTLSAINLQLNRYTQLLNNKTLTPEQLIQTSALVKHCYGEVRALVTSLKENKLNEEAEIFLVQLEELVHLITKPLAVNCHFEIGCLHTVREFSMEVQMEIYHILKECINNIVKHSEATDVYIKVSAVSGEIECEVSDNGHGFNPAQVRLRGLKSIQERLLRHTGKMKILPRAGGGTTMKFTLPKTYTTYDKYNLAG